MKVSFGQKIPIALTQIQNRKTGEFEPATIYEVDCKDEHDYLEVKKDTYGWNFPYEMAANMHCKYVTHNKYNVNDDSSYYVLLNKDYDTLGRIQIDRKNNQIYTVEWLDTKTNNGYKYVGQNLLAASAREVLRQYGKSFVVLSAFDDAVPFYLDTCQFTDCGKYGFHMDEKQMQEFIARTEKRTNGPIIDLKV